MRRYIGTLGLALAAGFLLLCGQTGMFPTARFSLVVHADSSLVLAPTSGIPGTHLTISAGPGAVPGGGTQLVVFRDPNGSTISTLGSVQPATDGSFSTTLQVPSYASGGVASVYLQGYSTVQAPFMVLPSLVLTPTIALPGSVITITGNGYKALAPISVSLDGSLLTLRSSVTTNPFGSFTTPVTLPLSVLGGQHTLTASDGSAASNQAGSQILIVAPTATPTLTPIPSPTSSATWTATPAPIVIFTTPTPGAISGATTAYFAEGYTGTARVNGKATFLETLNILNPGSTPASVTITYSIAGSASPVTVARQVPALGVLREQVTADVGTEKLVSAVVSSAHRIVVSRSIARVNAAGVTLDGSTTTGATALSSTWDFAEGYTGVSFQEYLTLFNPSSVAAAVRVTLAPQSSTAAGAPTLSLTVPAHARVTANIRALNAKGARSIGMQVRSTVPLAAERVLYFGDGAGSAKSGSTVSRGLNAPATELVIPYGVSGGATATAGQAQPAGDQEYLTILNPGSVAATVTAHAVDAAGRPLGVPASVTVAPGTRQTIVVTTAFGIGAAGPFSIALHATAPIEAEAAQYYGGSPNIGAHPGVALPAVTAASTALYLTDLGNAADLASPISRQIFLYNPSGTAIQVVVRYLTGAAATALHQYSVPAGGITVVNVTQDLVGISAATSIGADLQVVGGSGSFLAVAIARTADGHSATVETALPAS